MSEEFKKRIENYIKSHNMSEGDIFKILNKHDEELEREEIHDWENKIQLTVSAKSEKELKNTLDKAAKDNKELRIIKPPKSFNLEKGGKKPIKIIFRDDKWNEVRVSFESAEYFDKGVSTVILASFSYWPDIDSDTKDFLLEANPQSSLLKTVDNKTKIDLLTKLYNLIKNAQNS